MARSRELALPALALPLLSFGQNYDFGPNARLDQDADETLRHNSGHFLFLHLSFGRLAAEAGNMNRGNAEGKREVSRISVPAAIRR